MRSRLLPLCIGLLAAVSCPALWPEDPDLAALFSQRGLTGTLIIESLDGRTGWLHDEARCDTRFIPASTFKIPNTLIALETGAIRDENEIIAWDGQKNWSAAWNRDQNLTSAFQVSCVWFYQALARRVGAAAYLQYLQRLQYGNMLSSPAVDSFWLDGDLRISAREQIAFLRRLVNGQLPFRADHVRLLKKIMINEETPDHVLRAKTGWAVRTDSQIGWFVGWLERKNGETWLFALNFDGEFTKDNGARQEIARAALALKGLLP